MFKDFLFSMGIILGMLLFIAAIVLLPLGIHYLLSLAMTGTPLLVLSIVLSVLVDVPLFVLGGNLLLFN